jgi:hypothetical protein
MSWYNLVREWFTFFIYTYEKSCSPFTSYRFERKTAQGPSILQGCYRYICVKPKSAQICPVKVDCTRTVHPSGGAIGKDVLNLNLPKSAPWTSAGCVDQVAVFCRMLIWMRCEHVTLWLWIHLHVFALSEVKGRCAPPSVHNFIINIRPPTVLANMVDGS